MLSICHSWRADSCVSGSLLHSMFAVDGAIKGSRSRPSPKTLIFHRYGMMLSARGSRGHLLARHALLTLETLEWLHTFDAVSELKELLYGDHRTLLS